MKFFFCTIFLLIIYTLTGLTDPGSDVPLDLSNLRSLDYDTRGLDVLRHHPEFSSPEECARACREGEPPRLCYYHFTAELYTVLGA